MAQFGPPEGRGILEVRTAESGLIEGYFVPNEDPASETAVTNLSSDVKLIEVSPADGHLTIYPTNTNPLSGTFLGPKYSKIRSLVIPADVAPDSDLLDILDTLPSGFTTDYQYGLGLTQHCDVLVDLIEESTACTVIEFVSSGDPRVIQDKFLISFTKFNALRTELSRIKNRGQRGIRRVKETYAHNELAGALGLKPRKLSLGLLATSKWMTKIAAGEEPLNDEEQDALLAATAENAAQIATEAPQKMARLQRNIDLVNLKQLITSYEAALDVKHNENWWQQFFEENIFALQLLFGGPTVFVDAQVPIGDGINAVKGKKIADYVLKNALTNNAALVEIKKPSTKLMKKRPYRQGVYGVQSEIAEAVSQVLDQALQLTRHEMATKQRTGDVSWKSNAPRCFVVAGLATELDTDDKKKSFDLYREHLSSVRLVTYDEVLGQLVMLHEFLTAEESSDQNTPGHDHAETRQTLGLS